MLISRKSAQMPWLLKYCAEARVTNVKRAVLKRCKAKTRAKRYAKPDERLTFNALEKAMDRKYAAYEPPKRSLWDHLECHRQACVAGVEAPRLASFNPVEAWVEECNEGSSTIIIHGEKMMITTVSKTAEYGTSAAALAGSDKAFRYRIPEPPKVPARKRLPTPPRRPQGEAPMNRGHQPLRGRPEQPARPRRQWQQWRSSRMLRGSTKTWTKEEVIYVAPQHSHYEHHDRFAYFELSCAWEETEESCA